MHKNTLMLLSCLCLLLCLHSCVADRLASARISLGDAIVDENPTDVSKAIAAGVDPDAELPGGLPCVLAVRFSSVDVLEVLLDGGAQPDKRDKHGDRALTLAIRNGKMDHVRVLLNNGASAELLDGDKVSPLGMAAQTRNAELLDLLIASGASAATVNPDGTSNWSVLEKSGLQKYVNKLLGLTGNPGSAKNPWVLYSIFVAKDIDDGQVSIAFDRAPNEKLKLTKVESSVENAVCYKRWLQIDTTTAKARSFVFWNAREHQAVLPESGDHPFYQTIESDLSNLSPIDESTATYLYLDTVRQWKGEAEGPLAGTISGIVADGAGSPVAGAKLWLSWVHYATPRRSYITSIASATTNADGMYAFDKLNLRLLPNESQLGFDQFVRLSVSAPLCLKREVDVPIASLSQGQRRDIPLKAVSFLVFDYMYSKSGTFTANDTLKRGFICETLTDFGATRPRLLTPGLLQSLNNYNLDGATGNSDLELYINSWDTVPSVYGTNRAPDRCAVVAANGRLPISLNASSLSFSGTPRMALNTVYAIKTQNGGFALVCFTRTHELTADERTSPSLIESLANRWLGQ